MIRSPRQQLETFKGLISGRTLDKSSPTFSAALNWMKTYPGELTPDELVEFRTLICEAWRINGRELDEALSVAAGAPLAVPLRQRYSSGDLSRALADEKEFDALVPPVGFFRKYIEYTRESESPIAYHFFTALVGVAATVNRRIGFNFGPAGKIYPPLGIILLGPSGIKKTSAADIIVGMLMDTQVVPIYSEKVTPEALVEGMKKGQAVGLIYAPEMAVFMGKATYMDGLVPLLTRLMDSPDKWTTKTISRGDVTLTNVALTSLMCSTSDWFVGNTPADMFGGGFIARNLLIHQTISPRVVPIPKARDDNMRQDLLNSLLDIHVLAGEAWFSPAAEKAYIDFYHRNKFEKPEHEMLESYHQRKGSHSIRLSMSIHFATHGTMEICEECYMRALNIMGWVEKFLPGLLKTMFRTEVGLETDTVLRIIRAFDGAIPHSVLIRKLQYKMNARQVKQVCGALKESQDIIETHSAFGHTYQIKQEEAPKDE